MSCRNTGNTVGQNVTRIPATSQKHAETENNEHKQAGSMHAKEAFHYTYSTGMPQQLEVT